MSGELVAAMEAAMAVEAGKFVLGTLGLPTMLRVLQARFVNVDADDVSTAQERLGGFLRDLDTRAEAADVSDFSVERLKELFARPEVTGALYAAFESAMENDDSLKQRTLADLVIARLCAKDLSGWGPSSRIAIERIRDVTPRQVRILALVQVMHTAMVVTPDTSYGECASWIQEHTANLIDVPMHANDFGHLASLGLLDYDLSRGYLEMHVPTPIEEMLRRFPHLRNDDSLKSVIERITAFSFGAKGHGIPSLEATQLTPAGQLIATNALRENSGLEIEF